MASDLKTEDTESAISVQRKRLMFPLVQAYPRAETKWRRDDAALPGARVSHNHLEGKHVVEIRSVDISIIYQYLPIST